MPKVGWPAFGLWAVPGLVVGFLVTSIGVPLLPFGILATVLLARSTRVWPEMLGILEGIAGVCFLIVALNADYWSCPASGEVITRTRTSEIVESCGALSPWPWVVAGLVFALGGAASYAIAKPPPGIGFAGSGRALE